MEDQLSPVQRWYVDELNRLGSHDSAAKYIVDLFSLQAARKALVEVRLDGDMSKLFDPDIPKSVKDQWNSISSKMSALTREAERAHEDAGGPELEPELPEFLKEEYLTRKAMKLMGKGWYQDSVGELYHYDGVVWDNVPKVKIDDLEFLGG